MDQKLSSTEKNMDKKGVSRFSVEIFFCPKSPKNIVGEPFCLSENFWYQKFFDNKGIIILCNFFVSHRQKSSWANPSVFQNCSGFKVCRIIGVSRFCRLFLSHSTKKLAENPPLIQKV